MWLFFSSLQFLKQFVHPCAYCTWIDVKLNSSTLEGEPYMRLLGCLHAAWGCFLVGSGEPAWSGKSVYDTCPCQIHLRAKWQYSIGKWVWRKGTVEEYSYMCTHRLFWLWRDELFILVTASGCSGMTDRDWKETYQIWLGFGLIHLPGIRNQVVRC